MSIKNQTSGFHPGVFMHKKNMSYSHSIPLCSSLHIGR